MYQFKRLTFENLLQGAGAESAKICHFWPFLPIPICLKLNPYQFIFLMTKNGTLQVEISKFWVSGKKRAY